LYLNDFLSSLP